MARKGLAAEQIVHSASPERPNHVWSFDFVETQTHGCSMACRPAFVPTTAPKWSQEPCENG